MSSKDSVMNSELAVHTLSVIHRESESYTSEIARQLDKSQTSIDRIVRKLKEAGFIQVEKQTKAKYYSINYESLTNFWFEQLFEKIKLPDPNFQDALSIIDSMEGYSTPASKDKVDENIRDSLDQNETEIKEIFKKYLQRSLSSENHRADLGTVMNTGFYISLLKFQFAEPDKYPSYLIDVADLLKRDLGVLSLSLEVEEIVEEVED